MTTRTDQVYRGKASGDTSLNQGAARRSILQHKPICKSNLQHAPRIQGCATRLFPCERAGSAQHYSQLTCTSPVDLYPRWLRVSHQVTGYAGAKGGWQVEGQGEGGAVVEYAHAKRKDYDLYVYGGGGRNLSRSSVFSRPTDVKASM